MSSAATSLTDLLLRTKFLTMVEEMEVEPESHFQRTVRRQQSGNTARDHICKAQSALIDFWDRFPVLADSHRSRLGLA